MIRITVAFAVLSVIAPAAVAFEVGEKVIVIRDADVRVSNQAVDKLSHGIELQIGAVNGDWLWVSNGHPGWIDSRDVVAMDQAIPVLTEMIRKNPEDAQFHNGRGLVWIAKQNYESAIADFNEAIRLSPQAAWYGNRGVAWYEKGDSNKAILDFDEAIRLSPRHTHHTWYIHRGNALKANGEYDGAIADYNEAVRLNPKYVSSYNQLAWLWATCPDKRHRNGPKAVQYATKACELGAWKIADNLDTLAAAYAETGNFPEAEKWEQKAIDLASEDDRIEMRAHLEYYKHGKPFREEPHK